MRLRTHVRAASAAKGLPAAASSLVSGIPLRRLSDIEEGDRLPTGDELAALRHSRSRQSLRLRWCVSELVERMLSMGSDGASTNDEDLFSAIDVLTQHLAERERIYRQPRSNDTTRVCASGLYLP